MLSLLAPAGLLLGLTLPVVILLYLLKVRRVDQRVSSLFLWQSMPRDLAAQEPLQRLRLSVLLVLQLALLALATLALARPAVVAVGPPPVHLVLLLDASASMQAIDPGESASRFERARAAAEAAVQAAPEGSSFSVLEARAHPQVLLAREPSAARALEAIRAARVSGAAADMPGALLLARSLAGTGTSRRILAFTDQAYSLPPSERDLLGTDLEVVPVAGDAANSAITVLGARPRLADPDGQDLYVRLEHFADEPRTVEVELRVADQLWEVRAVELAPDKPAELVFEGVPTAAGAASVAIQKPAVTAAHDSLSLDDVGYFALQARRPTQVLLVSNGEPRLERALTLVRRAEVFRVTPRRYLAADVDRFDVVVFDRDVPPLLPRGNILILGPSGTAPFLPQGPDQILRQPQTLTWEQDDPLLAFVDLRGLSLRRARVLEAPAWARVPMRAEGAPIMLAGVDAVGRRVVVLGFTPLESNIASLSAFPILVNNIMDWLAPPALVSHHQLRTGEATDLTPLARARDLVVSGGGDQAARSIIPVPRDAAPITFGATDRPGVYVVEQRAQDGSLLPEATERFAVNLADPAESDLRPRGDSVVTTATQEVAEVPLEREFWWWVLGLALPLLALEGWWFHRR